MTIDRLRQLHQDAVETERDWELHDRACRKLFTAVYPALPSLVDIAEAAKQALPWLVDGIPDSKEADAQLAGLNLRDALNRFSTLGGEGDVADGKQAREPSPSPPSADPLPPSALDDTKETA